MSGGRTVVRTSSWADPGFVAEWYPDARSWVRGHTVAERFGCRYDAEELEELAQRAEALSEEADGVRVMFNNNRGDDAPVGAQQMKDLLS